MVWAEDYGRWVVSDKFALSRKLQEVAECLERYGDVDADVLAVLDTLGDFVDDRNHGRNLGPTLAKIQLAVDKLGV